MVDPEKTGDEMGKHPGWDAVHLNTHLNNFFQNILCTKQPGQQPAHELMIKLSTVAVLLC